MTFFQESSSRLLLRSILIFQCFIFIISMLVFFHQSKKIKTALLERDQCISSYLLEQDVSPNLIALALTGTQKSPEGISLLASMGYTEETGSFFFPVLQPIFFSSLCFIFLSFTLSAVVLLILCCSHLAKRDADYRSAQAIIEHFSEGDFHILLPASENGSLYQLFSSINNLATALQSKGEKERQMRAFLKDTISDISHQLKTPLAALTMYNEIIAKEPENSQVVSSFCEKTGNALNRMEQLILSLLKITRLDAGNIVFEEDIFLLEELVSHAIEPLTTRACLEKKELILSGSSSCSICCDWNWTSEAIENIVKNALDHTPSHSKIEITWEVSPILTRIFVTDYGFGISPDDIHHIFKRFYRSKSSLTQQGTGLGLSLAKAILEGQGGSVSVQSIPMEKTTFTLSFLTKL